MAEVDVPLAAEAMTVVGGAVEPRRKRARRPLLRSGVQRLRVRVPDVTEKHMLGIRGKPLHRIFAVDRANDRERVHLDAVGVRLFDQILKWIERRMTPSVRLTNSRLFGQRLARLEIPGIAAAANLHEERVRVAVDGGADDLFDVRVTGQRRVERLGPERAVLGGRGGSWRYRKEQRQQPTRNGPHLDRL